MFFHHFYKYITPKHYLFVWIYITKSISWKGRIIYYEWSINNFRYIFFLNIKMGCKKAVCRCDNEEAQTRCLKIHFKKNAAIRNPPFFCSLYVLTFLYIGISFNISKQWNKSVEYLLVLQYMWETLMANSLNRMRPWQKQTQTHTQKQPYKRLITSQLQWITPHITQITKNRHKITSTGKNEEETVSNYYVN